MRVDTHLYQGYKVPPYYDSLLAKIIVHAPNRNEAINRMIRALDELVVEGVYTTASFLRGILASETFRSGKYSTHYVDDMRKKKEKAADKESKK